MNPGGRWWTWPLWCVAAAVAWYGLVGGTWLAADLVDPVEPGSIGSPLVLPLLPAQILRLAGAALVVSVAVAVAVPRRSAAVVGVVGAAAASAVLAVRALRGSTEDFWSDPRLLVPELVLLGIATVGGLAAGSWGGRRPERAGVLLALVSPVITLPVTAAVHDLVRWAGGTVTGAPVPGLPVLLLQVAAPAAAGLLLAGYRRAGWLLVAALYVVAASHVLAALQYVLDQVRVGMPQNLPDLVASGFDLLRASTASVVAWLPLAALAVGAATGSVRPAGRVSSSPSGSPT